MFFVGIAQAWIRATLTRPERPVATMAKNEEISEIKKSLDFAHKEIEKLQRHLEDCLGQNSEFERRLSALEKENEETKSYAEDLEDYILTLDSATRKRNLIISGLPEDKGETTETLPLTVYKFVQPYVTTLELHDIDCAYRLGKKDGKSRLVLCKFVKEKVRNTVAAIRTNLNEEGNLAKIYLNDDLPQLLNERRAKFRKIVKLAKSKKIPASTRNDKITVNNITYSHKNLDCLPEGLKLEDVMTVKVKGGLAFCSEDSWLSNFFPCEIDISGMKFQSAEHAYQYARSMRLGDPQLAAMIHRSKNAKAAKSLSSNLISNDEWDHDKIDVMRKINEEKFLQNPELCQKLVATGQTILIEATTDGYWGAKAVINSKAIRTGTWMGANFMGKILMETRTIMRRELGIPEPPKEPNAPDGTGDGANPPPHPPHGNQHQLTTTTTGAHVNKQQTQTSEELVSQDLINSNNRKNKNHQSPIKSPSASSAPQNKKKKARLFSPKSSLPPRRTSIGDLFCLSNKFAALEECPDEDSMIITSSCV